MSSKQDRTWARTAADIDRRENFGKVLGIAEDARTYAAEAKKVSAEVAETANGIALKVNNGMSAQFELSVEETEDEGEKKVFSLINGEATKIHFEADSILIESTNFTLAEDGTCTIKVGNIGGCKIENGTLIVPTACLTGSLNTKGISADGIVASNVNLTGKITAEEGSFGNAHITSEGDLYGIEYDGLYLGTDDKGTFFGLKNDRSTGYHSLLALGLDAANGVLLTNKDIEVTGSGLIEPLYIEWKDLYNAVRVIKAKYPSEFQN